MSNDEKYILTLTKEQARTTMDALELYARLRIGQFDRIPELLLNVQDADNYCKRREIANDLLSIAAGIIFGKNAYGQLECRKDKLHHRAWNIYTALRYKMAWHDHPEGGWTVCFDEPYPWGGEDVPDCKVVESNKVMRHMECKGCKHADRNGLCMWPDNSGDRPCEEKAEE